MRDLTHIADEFRKGRVLSNELKKGTAPAKRLRGKDLKVMTTALARLLDGGVPLLKAMEGIQKTVPEGRLKDVLQKLCESVKQGRSLSDALESLPGVAPFYFSPILFAGEVSGNLPHVLKELSGYLEKEGILKNKIREAVSYPAFILCMGFGTLTVLLKVVLPKLALIYQDFDADLPMITRIVLGLSHWVIPVLVFSVGVAFLFCWVWSTDRGKAETLLLNLPLGKPLYQSWVLVRFSMLTALLLESGVSILTALDVVAKTFSGPSIIAEIRLIHARIAEGGAFTQVLNGIRWMDPLSKMLIASGEETGRLPDAFFQISKDAQLQTETDIRIATKLLEPLLILTVGLIVGGVVIATILPVFDISGIMK